jgi:lipopolysaccharide/colanic/teichoic acid biosynthesis glycosyltransferase
MERKDGRSPDVERAAQRLARPATRAALALKRLVDVVLALAMLVALLPVLLLVVGLMSFAGDGRWIEKRQRLGRTGRAPGWLRRARARARGRA